MPRTAPSAVIKLFYNPAPAFKSRIRVEWAESLAGLCATERAALPLQFLFLSCKNRSQFSHGTVQRARDGRLPLLQLGHGDERRARPAARRKKRDLVCFHRKTGKWTHLLCLTKRQRCNVGFLQTLDFSLPFRAFFFPCRIGKLLRFLVCNETPLRNGDCMDVCR